MLEKTLETWTARRSNHSILKEISPGCSLKDWCWSWNSNTLATSWEVLIHCKRPWCWEGLGAEGEGEYRGWDGWMASPTQWTWVWVDSGSWWWTGRPGMLRFMGSQRVRHKWENELNWTEKRIGFAVTKKKNFSHSIQLSVTHSQSFRGYYNASLLPSPQVSLTVEHFLGAPRR